MQEGKWSTKWVQYLAVSDSPPFLYRWLIQEYLRTWQVTADTNKVCVGAGGGNQAKAALETFLILKRGLPKSGDFPLMQTKGTSSKDMVVCESVATQLEELILHM